MSGERHAHCPTCRSTDVGSAHVEWCAEFDRLEKVALESGGEAGIPNVTTIDLWAHVNSAANPILATRVVQLAVGLGWRPVVGSDPKRLWASTQRPEAGGER